MRQKSLRSERSLSSRIEPPTILETESQVSNPSPRSEDATYQNPIVLPCVVGGLGTTLLMWVLWWVGHHPSLAVPPSITLALLLVAHFAGAAWTARRTRGGALVGAGTALFTALVNLMLLGSWLVEQPESTEGLREAQSLRPGAGIVVVSSLAGSAVLGAVVGALSGRKAANAPAAGTDWPSALAAVTACSFIPLLIAGGTVTSTESGLAVPDPVTTFGVNPFLFPLSLMAGDTAEPRVFFEHTHRLLGWLAGFHVLVMTIAVCAGERRAWARIGAIALLVLVGVQGWLGAARVGEQSVGLAIAHGVFGQGVFAFGAGLAGALGRYRAAGNGTTDDEAAGRGRRAAWVLLGALAIQLAMGAAFRHLRREGSPGAMHALWTHAGFAIVVVVVAVALGAALSRSGGSRARRRIGKGLMHTVGLQFLLGWAAFAAVLTAGSRGPVPQADQVATAMDVPWWEALLATAHQVNGALLLALASLALVWTRRRA